MNSIIAVLGLTLCLAAQGAQPGTAPKPADFQGVWTGVAVIPDQGDDQVTLTLKVDKGACTGTIQDSTGLIAAPDILNVTIEQARITFDITLGNPNGTFPVHVELTLESDTLVGKWWNDGGETGPVKIARKSAL